jgi:hypothetical protein
MIYLNPRNPRAVAAIGALAATLFLSPAAAQAQSTSTEPPPAPASERKDFAAAVQRGDFLSTLALHVTLGLAYGGEEFATLTYADGSENTVRGGEGLILSGGLTFTPLWFGDRFGLGLGVDAGWKYKSTSVNADASVKLERFPVVTSARALVHLGKAWHVLAAGGLVVELGPNLYGDGLLEDFDVEFDTAIGGMAELGILWGRPDGLGYEVTGRYTGLGYTHESSSESFDASSGSIHLGVHYFF